MGYFLDKLFNRKNLLVESDHALQGREEPVVGELPWHLVLDQPCSPPFPENLAQAIFGLGCFWGAERAFWKVSGVYSTMVGYAGGFTPHPTYHEVCSGRTGHAEVVRVVYDPGRVTYGQLLAVFWESHDPTQGFRQGNDSGSQYRSIIIATTELQLEQAETSKQGFQTVLDKANQGKITTEVLAPTHLAPTHIVKAQRSFYYAEIEHQQYLAKNPAGYCGLGGLGLTCPPVLAD